MDEKIGFADTFRGVVFIFTELCAFLWMCRKTVHKCLERWETDGREGYDRSHVRHFGQSQNGGHIVAEAWNGANWDIDPVTAGYTKDGEHPNQTGAEVMAEALRATGYEPVAP
jgi:hypothetical protein